jgi:ribonuclease HI
MIVNTGLLLDDPTAAKNTRVYAATRHPIFDRYEWRHQGNGLLQGIALDQKWGLRAAAEPTEMLSARYHAWGQPLEFTTATGPAHVLEDYRILQNSEQGVVILAGHPDFNHGPTLPPLLVERHRAFDRRTLARALTAGKRTKEHHERTVGLIEHRLERGTRDEKEVFDALQAVTPTTYTRPLEGLTVYQQLFRYKLVLGAHNTRDGNGTPVPCPHDTCADADDPSTLGHIIWRCPLAQRAWKDVTDRWTWREASTPYPTQVFFLPEPPAPARALRELFAEEVDEATGRAAFTLIWRTLCTIVSHQLWLARNNGCFREIVYTTDSFTAILWATVRRQVSALAASMGADGTHERMQLGRGVKIALDHLMQPAVLERTATTEVRVYYDGGARGNPGVSGAGYVIIAREADQRWEVVTGEAIYCGAQNTNNVAEHTGVARGLEACQQQVGDKAVCVHVIGDSALVARQLTGAHRVRQPTLQPLAARSARALAGLFDYQILHVRRAGNKMADYLANVAMDERRTIRIDPTDTSDPRVRRLKELLCNDLEYKGDHVQSTATLLTSIKNALGVTATNSQDASPPPARPTKRHRTDTAT